MIRAIFAVLLLLSGPALADSLTYKNSRFGTSMVLPMDIIPLEAPYNGDGRMFRYQGLKGIISVYGQNSISPNGLSGYRSEMAKQYETITYSVAKSGWFVMSGYDRGNVFYLRVSGCDSGPFHNAYFSFPESEKSSWEPIIEGYAATIDGPCK